MKRMTLIGLALLTFFIAGGPAFAQNDKSISSRLTKLEQDVLALLAQITSLQGKVNALEGVADDLQEEVLSAENRIAALEAAQAGGATPPIMWSGGSSQHGFGLTGWIRYLTDMEEINTAADFLSVNPNGTITVSQPGFFRINFRTISYGLDYLSIQIRKNGQAIHYGKEHGGGNWTDNFADITYPFRAGDTIEVCVYCPSGASYAFHYSSAFDSFSRLQVQYIGPLPPES